MTSPQKICPQCQTPAPLDAAFCRRCGRQYRTQFAATGVPAASAPPLAQPPTDFSSKPAMAFSRPMLQGIAVLGALVVFLGVLAVRSATRHDPAPAAAPTDRSLLPQPPPYSAPQVSTTTSSDPVNDQAKRFIEQARQENGLEPPSGSVGSDGKIHLQSGGTITKEEWDRASRSIKNSPLNPPMPPPPVP